MSINATAVWRVRPLGSNTNGGGYDPGISGAATDYSQQNAAQASGTNGVTTGTTTFVDSTANAFTSAMVGNAMHITGTGQTTGWYFVTAYTSASTVTLDRSPGTGTGATWALGGGWADYWTNPNAAGNPLVAGNQVLVLGSGIPNPASYTYDYTFTGSTANAGATGGYITIAADPSTPSYGSGGMPCVKWNVGNAMLLSHNGGNIIFKNMWFVAGSSSASNYMHSCYYGAFVFTSCVFDQFSYDCGLWFANTGAALQNSQMIGCECFSSVAPGSAGTHAIASSNELSAPLQVYQCNIHDCVGVGLFPSNGAVFTLVNNIIAKCNGTAVYMTYVGTVIAWNNTLDGNGGNGFDYSDSSNNNSYAPWLVNNIITNHTGASKAGINTNATCTGGLEDYNSFYNNTQNSTGTLGTHDTVLGTTPYVAQSTENYTLA